MFNVKHSVLWWWEIQVNILRTAISEDLKIATTKIPVTAGVCAPQLADQDF